MSRRELEASLERLRNAEERARAVIALWRRLDVEEPGTAIYRIEWRNYVRPEYARTIDDVLVYLTDAYARDEAPEPLTSWPASAEKRNAHEDALVIATWERNEVTLSRHRLLANDRRTT